MLGVAGAWRLDVGGAFVRIFADRLGDSSGSGTSSTSATFF